MIKLVSALLNVSRIELGTFIVEPEKIDLQKVSQSVLAEVKKSIDDKKLKIIENYKSEVGKVNADPNLIRIVFQNLVTNAIKYTPEKGTITISIDRVKAKDSDQEGYLIKCADTGYGIPKDQQSKIFTKLFRADNVRDKSIDGTGLGLYIIKSILEHSKGKIWFESELNKGTTFYVFLPREGMVKKAGTKKLN
jgi:signal transduction histidine kinase